MPTRAFLPGALSGFASALVVPATLPAASDSAARRIVRTLAAVGRGRALLDSGDFAGAAAAVAAVPTNFVYTTFHSTATDRQKNGVFVFNNQAPLGTARFSVADVEGANGLNFPSAADPPVPDPLPGKGFAN